MSKKILPQTYKPSNQTQISTRTMPANTNQLREATGGSQFKFNKPQLVNIVSTASLLPDATFRLNLRQIALWCRNVEYNPKRFSAAVMRIREPKATGLIFSTGKIVITGAKTIEFALTAAKLIEKAIIKVLENNSINKVTTKMEQKEEKSTSLAVPTQEYSTQVKLTDFKVVNIVAQADVGFSIKLEALLDQHKSISDCHYEPELFPGLIYRIKKPKVVLLIFASGKIVLAGAKKREDINEVFNTFGPTLYIFRKDQLSLTPTRSETKQRLMAIQKAEKEVLAEKNSKRKR